MQMHEGWRQAVLSAGAGLLPHQRTRAEALHLRYLALWGFKLAPMAFLGAGHRGPATLIACLIAPVIPTPLRRALFA